LMPAQQQSMTNVRQKGEFRSADLLDDKLTHPISASLPSLGSERVPHVPLPCHAATAKARPATRTAPRTTMRQAEGATRTAATRRAITPTGATDKGATITGRAGKNPGGWIEGFWSFFFPTLDQTAPCNISPELNRPR
jgi:hypothetical protein